ncbi:MAG: helix-turn-helix domain-containing protein [Janthinobacterium lividum]
MLNELGSANSADTTKRLRLCIGENIRQARSRQGASLADLGNALGIEEALIANYEAGLYQPPLSLTVVNHVASIT